MKTIIHLLIVISLCYLPLAADDGGDVNIVLQGYIQEYEAATTPEEKSKLLNHIFVEATLSDMAMAKAYQRELKKLADSSNLPIVITRHYKVLGILTDIEKVSLDTSLYWYNRALETIAEFDIKDLELEISIYNNKAIAYIEANLPNLAIKEYTAGIEILKKSGQKSYGNEALLYSNISSMMLGSGRYKEALDHILKAEEANDAEEKIIKKHTTYYEYILTLKGQILYHLDEYDQAEEALQSIITNDNKLDIMNNYGKIMLGKVYAKNGKHELAKNTLKEGFQDARKLNLGIDNQTFATIELAKLELHDGNPTSSLKHLDYIFALYAKEDRDPDDVEIYETMAKALEKSGRFEESLMYTKKYQTLLGEEKEKENSVKFGELEQQISSIEKQYEINELEIKQKLQQSKMTMLIVAFVLSLLLMIFIYFMYARKEEHNRSLLKINKEVTLAKDKALAAAKVKENFLATMSHEMRTPMNAVIGLTNILLDEEPNPKQVEHLNNLKFSGEGLLNIINEVLDFSKIEARRLEIVKKEFNLQLLLDKMIKSIRHGNSNLNVKIFQDQQLVELKHTVNGDEKRINQILTNLLGNAIKFTNEGHIVLRSRIIENTDNIIKVKFQVEDSGIGIPEDKLESIFESFSQVNNEINRVHQGTGLGLAITKSLVELQGGVIDVKSTKGRGTTFSFILELQKVDLIHKKVKEDAKSKIFQSGIEGRKILLVEDNKLNQIVALKVLKKFEVVTALAQNGQEAVEMVQKEDYDLILMDIHMPIMDGIEATKNIRALNNEIKNKIPIIALSADAYSDKVKAATECGMNDYLSKPFKPGDLFQKIQTNIDSSWSIGA